MAMLHGLSLRAKIYLISLLCMCVSVPVTWANLQCAAHERMLADTQCQCEAGYSRQGSECVACPVATFKEFSGDTVVQSNACNVFAGCCACRVNTITLATASVHAESCLCLPGYGGPACLPCAIGYHKTTTSADECSECPAGSTTENLKSTSVQDCIAARGHYGNLISGFQKCPNGTYAPTTGLNHCQFCPVGSSSDAGAISQTECQCILEGWKSTSDGLCTCLLGYAHDAENICRLCSDDSFCTGGDSKPIKCPENSHSFAGASNQADCLCDAGYTFLPANSDNQLIGQCIACPAGYYKEEKGNANCLACAEHAHSVTASTTKTACLCTSGYTGDDGGPCTACSIGKYKTSVGSETCVHCWPHSTNLAIASNNSLHCLCNAGYELIDTQCQKCQPGSYKSTVSSESCNQHCPSYSISAAGSTSILDCECNSGYFGVAANAQCTACAAGTYKSQIGSSECLACTDNATTLSIANVDTSDCLCKLGFYSSHACKILFTEECICTECSENFYGTHLGCVPCPPDTHAQAGSNDISMCKCNAGFTKTGVNLHTQAPICSSCPVGTYSISGEEEKCLNCPENSSTTDIGASRVSQCLCLPGFILNSNNGECEMCPANTFQETYPNGVCISCPAHSTSDSGSISKLDCVCQAGYSGPAGGECWECQEGQYKDIVGSATCSSCPAYTTSQKASTQKLNCTCLPGYVGLAGNPCVACPTSTYEMNGVCVLCPQYTFAPIASSTVESCKCTPGFVASELGICKPCPFGFYRADNDDTCVACGIMSNTTYEGSGHKNQCLCNPGYSTIEQTVETIGEIQTIEQTDDSTLCKECPENTYKSKLGMQSCKSCPANSVAPVASSSMSACNCLPGFIEAGDGTCAKVCAAGYEPLLQETCVACDFNYYKSTSGNDKCLPCSPYSFTLFQNTTKASDCICQEGFIWNSVTLKCDMCPPGFFNNEANSTTCYPCVTNCQNLETEEKSLDLLLSYLGSNTHCPGICKIPPGFEIAISSDMSASTIVRCATNHFQDGTAKQCTQCPSPSTYSNSTGLSSILDCSCRPGYYRLAGICTACPLGSFQANPYNENYGSFACQSCPANMYTLFPASTHISDCKCMPGYNLVNGSCTPTICPENSVLHIVDHVAECQCKQGFESNTLLHNFEWDACVPCSDGAYKDSIGFHKCLTCGANTQSTLPRNNITSCYCKSAYEPQYEHGPDILGGLCVPECPAGKERVNGICKACKANFFRKQTDEACLPCPSPRTVSQSQSTHENQCYCPYGFLKIEPNQMLVVQELGHMMPESKQYLKAENFLVYEDNNFLGAELSVSGSVSTQQIRITVADRVVFYCGCGSCIETIIDLNGMRGTLKALTNSSSTPQAPAIFTLSWFTQRQVLLTGHMQSWLPAAIIKAQTWAAAGQIQKGDTIFQTSKLYSSDTNTCSVCPEKLICS
jgi:hypothetical protein